MVLQWQTAFHHVCIPHCSACVPLVWGRRMCKRPSLLGNQQLDNNVQLIHNKLYILTSVPQLWGKNFLEKPQRKGPWWLRGRAFSDRFISAQSHTAGTESQFIQTKKQWALSSWGQVRLRSCYRCVQMATPSPRPTQALADRRTRGWKADTLPCADPSGKQAPKETPMAAAAHPTLISN